MPNTINFATPAQTIEFVSATNELAQASGWDMATAVQYLNPEVASNGLRLVGFESQAGAEAITEFNTANAADAFASYIESGGLAAGSGAAALSTSIGAGTVALCKTSALPVATVGVATGTAGAIAAAGAPVFGAALGYGLYEASPDFWTRLSATLLPWCYEGTNVLPFFYDADGNTYISQSMIQAMESLFDSGIVFPDYKSSGSIIFSGYVPVTGESVISEFQTLNSAFECVVPSALETAINNLTAGKCCFVSIQQFTNPPTSDFGSGNAISIAVMNPPATGATLTLGNQRLTVYNISAAANLANNTLSLGASPNSFNQYVTVFEGEYTTGPATRVDSVYHFSNINVQEVPATEGIERWQGQPYPSSPNSIDILTGFDELGEPIYEPAIQVAMPIGDPLTTNDPLIQPSPYTNPLPEIDPDTGTKVYPAIDPYVNPNPSPQEFPAPNDIPEDEPGHIGDPNLNPAPLPSVEEVPLPATETVPDPAVDPSAEPVPESEPANPIQPAGPTNTGSSPTPTIPVFPPFPDGNASLYHVYNPTNAQLQQFGSWLWTTFSGNLIDTLSKLFNNPMDAVISLQEFYYTPNIQGQGTIRCGYLDSEVPSALVGNRYSTLNCGSIIIPEYWGNYLDYSPYSQVIAYLPFIGFMSLNADDVIGNAVNITYHIDSYTGSVIAIITVARQGYETVVYQFEGNCSVDVPVTGGQQSSIKGAIIGGISGAVMGGVPGAIAGAAIGGLSTKNDVQHSGSFSASYGAMGAKVPFIVVRRPIQKVVYNYNESYGYQAHKMVYVGNCRGYLRAREVRVFSTKATNEEKEMIVNALKAGVYVKN